MGLKAYEPLKNVPAWCLLKNTTPLDQMTHYRLELMVRIVQCVGCVTVVCLLLSNLLQVYSRKLNFHLK